MDFVVETFNFLSVMSGSKALSPCLVDELPRELLAAVFAYLSPLELVRCEQVCTWWNEVGRVYLMVQ